MRPVTPGAGVTRSTCGSATRPPSAAVEPKPPSWADEPSPRTLAAPVAATLAVLVAAACSDPAQGDWLGQRVEAGPAAAARSGVTGAPAVAGANPTDTLCIDTARSRVRWRGTEVGGGGHEGVVRLSAGRLRRRDGEVAGGEFTVDMRTLSVTDIPPHEVEARRQLRSHLAHEEFFGVDRFPTATFVITDLDGGEHGLYTVSGDLAIRDSVHNVTFRASATVLERDRAWATASFRFDRRRWGIDFDGATSALRNALVHDDIQLRLELVADRRSCPG